MSVPPGVDILPERVGDIRRIANRVETLFRVVQIKIASRQQTKHLDSYTGVHVSLLCDDRQQRWWYAVHRS
jgi:hypothetical protein